MNTPAIISVAAAYLLGSVSFAVVVSKAMHLPDPYSYGSGNPGATNVLRTGNKKAAILTLLGDFLKGVVAVLIAKWAVASFGASAAAIALSAMAAFIGHCFPIFHGFKGGKGVATAGGVILAANAMLGAMMIAIWVAVALLTRMSSAASIVAAAAAPVIAWAWAGDAVLAAALAVIAAILIFRHRANIAKIMSGTEGKIGQKKTG